MERQAKFERMFHLYESPLNKGSLPFADATQHATSIQCNDDIRIWLSISVREQIADARWSGEGCLICEVAASLLTEAIKGLSTAEARCFTEEQLLEQLAIPLNESRRTCALLPLRALQGALETYPPGPKLATAVRRAAPEAVTDV